MRSSDVKRHWERLAREHGPGIAATTKTSTIKSLEIAALLRALRASGVVDSTSAEILEVGCGNGRNCIELAAALPAAHFTGVDYVPQMIESAREAGAARNLVFEVGDVLTLGLQSSLREKYDVVFTDRCLINLMTVGEQLQALDQLILKVGPGGHLVILENTIQAFSSQNELRKAAGLPRRSPPEHNLFIDETLFLAHAGRSLELRSIEEFAALHDLVLYILVPMTNGGTVDYQHALVEAATDLLSAQPDAAKVRGAGQNRLFHFIRR